MLMCNFVLYRVVPVGSLYFILISYYAMYYYNEMLYSEWQSNAQENVCGSLYIAALYKCIICVYIYASSNTLQH